MSEKFVIVVGDKTSHGGTVLTGDPNFEICDKPAVFLGDIKNKFISQEDP